MNPDSTEFPKVACAHMRRADHPTDPLRDLPGTAVLRCVGGCMVTGPFGHTE